MSKRKIYLAIALLLLSPMALIDVSHAAGRIFYADFEDGTTNAFSAQGGHPRCPAVTVSRDGKGPKAGTWMAECNWDGILDDYSGLLGTPWSYTREFFIRYWVRYDADVDRKDGGKVFRMYHPPQYDFYWGAQNNLVNEPLFMQHDLVADGTALPPTYGNAEHFLDGQWHKFEHYFLENTTGQSNGILRHWVDGVVVYEFVNTPYSKSSIQWQEFSLMSNWSTHSPWQHDANNHLYWDNFEIYSDTGMGGTGLMSNATIKQGGSADITPPATPVNLQIQ